MLGPLPFHFISLLLHERDSTLYLSPSATLYIYIPYIFLLLLSSCKCSLPPPLASSPLPPLSLQVRRTLAYSVHEMALILGPALAHQVMRGLTATRAPLVLAPALADADTWGMQALIPAADAFVKDLDEVKVGVVQV